MRACALLQRRFGFAVGPAWRQAISRAALSSASLNAASVARVGESEYLSAPSLRSCVVAALRRARGEDATSDDPTIERVWTDLVTQARISGALIGAFATDEETP